MNLRRSLGFVSISLLASSPSQAGIVLFGPIGYEVIRYEIAGGDTNVSQTQTLPSIPRESADPTRQQVTVATSVSARVDAFVKHTFPATAFPDTGYYSYNVATIVGSTGAEPAFGGLPVIRFHGRCDSGPCLTDIRTSPVSQVYRSSSPLMLWESHDRSQYEATTLSLQVRSSSFMSTAPVSVEVSVLPSVVVNYETFSFEELIAGDHVRAGIDCGPGYCIRFTPGHGISLDVAARAGGFDHFNFVSVVRSAPTLPLVVLGAPKTPFLDPMAGGYSDYLVSRPWHDDLPYYYDEKLKPDSVDKRFDMSWQLGHRINTSPDSTYLDFYDYPRTLGFGEAEFFTSLVGVQGPRGTGPTSGPGFKVLRGFRWSSSMTLDSDHPEHIELGSLLPAPVGVTGTIRFEEIDLASIPLDVRELLVSAGAKNLAEVSEPSTILSMLLGLAFLAGTTRCRLDLSVTEV